MPRSNNSDSSSLDSSFFSDHSRRKSDAASSNTDFGSFSEYLKDSVLQQQQNTLLHRNLSNSALERLQFQAHSRMYAQFTAGATNEQWSEQNGHAGPDINAGHKASPILSSVNNGATPATTSMSRENSNSQLGNPQLGDGLGFGNELWDMSFLTSSAGNSHNIDTPNSHMMEGMMFGQEMDSNTTNSQTFPDMSMDTMSMGISSSNSPAYLHHLQAYGAFTGKSSESPLPSHDDKAMYMPSSTAESHSVAPSDSPSQHSFSRSRKPGTLSFGSNELIQFDVNNPNHILGMNHSQTPEALSPQSANPAMFSPTFMDALNSVNGQTNVFDFANFDAANAGSLQPPQSARLAGGHRRNSSAASQPGLQHSHQASLDSNTPATPAAAQVHHSIFNSNQIHSNPATIQPSAMTMVAPPESAFNPTPTFSELMSMERQTSSSSSIYSNGDDTNMAAAAAAFFGRKPSHMNGVTGESSMDHTHEDLMTVKLEPVDSNLSVGSATPNGASTASQGATTPTIMEEEEADHHQHLLSPSMMESYYGQQLQKANGPGAATQRMMQPANVDHLRMLIRQYLNTPDPLAFGERTVLLMTSKVAQKSYGTEKRFLCPPPTVILLGNNWWASAGVSMLAPPRLSISISGENAVQAGTLEWFNRNGDTVEPDSNVSDVAIAGKSVAKQLFINDADEKRKRVEVLVKVQLASTSGTPNPMTDIKSLGQFGSRGIKVISKPSKKRQSVKNMELCIHHGTAISLFNRIRSQTVSTKYLGVSTSSTALTGFTTSTWMPPPQSLAASNQAQGNTCFVARTGSWDPFIIWIVDTRLQAGATDIEGKPPLANVGSPSIGCPPPPAVALRTTTENGNPIPIHYNQPVLLQCLTTGLISPVMIIRKVDKGSMVVGSTAQDDRTDDTIGDPISQLHKVAFQIHTPESKPEVNLAIADPGESGRYLACLGDVVGMQRAEGTRKWVHSPTPPNALSPASPPSFGNPSDMMPPPPVPNMNAMTAAAWATAQTQYSNAQANRSTGNDSPTELVGGEATANAAGGKTANRRRRVSSSVAVKPTTGGVQKAVTGVAAKNRRRGSSMSSAIKSNTSGDFSELVASTKNKDYKGSSAPTWTEDVTDSAVWTIVGTDCAKYSFYVPPMDETKGCNPSLPVTPIPVVSHLLAPSAVQGHHHSKSVGDIPLGGNNGERVSNAPSSGSGSSSGSTGFVMIYGECFTRDLSVWFGDIPSERTEHRCREVLAALPPPRFNGRLPILLVRADGVIYRTGKYYP